MNFVKTRDGRNFFVPFLLITSLFFLWGFAHSILDVLNKYFQDEMGLTKTRSALIQAVVYGGYFLMALPAGAVITRWGYRVGVLTGLLLYGVGALLFIPGGQIMNFEFFLFSLFIIGCGLTFLETSANPYATVLGEPESAERRINFAQSFNGFGWIVGPLVGGAFLFTADGSAPNITLPYAIIGTVVILIAAVFSRMKLPEIEAAPETTDDLIEIDEPQPTSRISLFRHKNFLFGLLAIFLYVAAQTGINSFFINYAVDNTAISESTAAQLLGMGCMGLFMLGRMGGSWAMGYIKPERLLMFCGLGATIATTLVVAMPGQWGFYSLFFVYFCESIMFPTIFALALRGLGTHTKMASSFLIMGIVGGAVAPLLMGLIADAHNMAAGFIIPLLCFVVITTYGAYVHRKK